MVPDLNPTMHSNSILLSACFVLFVVFYTDALHFGVFDDVSHCKVSFSMISRRKNCPRGICQCGGYQRCTCACSGQGYPRCYSRARCKHAYCYVSCRSTSCSSSGHRVRCKCLRSGACTCNGR